MKGNMCTISVLRFVSVPLLMHQHGSWLMLLVGGAKAFRAAVPSSFHYDMLHAEDVYFLRRCLSNLADECATSNHGGCWHKDYTVNGKTKIYSACQDNIKDYKVCLAALLPPLSVVQYV